MNSAPSLAVVVPFFNEERNLGAMCRELRGVLDRELTASEVILVDAGSSDRTGVKLDEIALGWPACRVFHLGENQGQSAALLFGFGKSTAPVIVTMDGDGQNDPRDIFRLLPLLEDADMVVGARVERQDPWMRRQISRIANSIRSRVLSDGVSDAGCPLKAFRRAVVGAFIPIHTLYSFMPALAVGAGFRVIETPVNHRPRRNATSKYTVHSFSFLTILDLIGLRWFRSRRCQVPRLPLRAVHPATMNLGEELDSRALRRWMRMAALGVVVCLIGSGIMLLPRERRTSQRIGLYRAERIALRDVPKGRVGSVELSLREDRLVWTIDVKPPAAADLHEVEIDARDGHVIAARTESAEEEALEVAVEEHRPLPKNFIPR